MPNGIEIFDEKGRKIFDGTSRLPKLIGIIDAGTGTGTLVVDTSSESNGVWAYAFNADGSISNYRSQAGIVSVSGKTVSWSNPFYYKAPMTIYYGEY